MDEPRNVVEGFAFESRHESEKALREAESVRYIRDRISHKNPRMALEMYRKLVAERVFETPVGLLYLKELQEYLFSRPETEQEELEPICVAKPQGGGAQAEVEAMAAWYEDNMNQERQRRRNAETRRDRMEREVRRLRKRLYVSFAGVAFFLILVIGMVVITVMDDHPNIINYENKIVDQYETWEQELEEREAALEEREKELGRAE